MINYDRFFNRESWDLARKPGKIKTTAVYWLCADFRQDLQNRSLPGKCWLPWKAVASFFTSWNLMFYIFIESIWLFSTHEYFCLWENERQYFIHFMQASEIHVQTHKAHNYECCQNLSNFSCHQLMNYRLFEHITLNWYLDRTEKLPHNFSFINTE